MHCATTRLRFSAAALSAAASELWASMTTSRMPACCAGKSYAVNLIQGHLFRRQISTARVKFEGGRAFSSVPHQGGAQKRRGAMRISFRSLPLLAGGVGVRSPGSEAAALHAPPLVAGGGPLSFLLWAACVTQVSRGSLGQHFGGGVSIRRRRTLRPRASRFRSSTSEAQADTARWRPLRSLLCAASSATGSTAARRAAPAAEALRQGRRPPRRRWV